MADKGKYRDYFEALAQRESNGQPEFVSSQGYLGKYQFAEVSLEAIGYYRGDGTPDVQDFIGRWTGRDEIRSTEDFLKSESVQDSAIREYHNVLWDEITQNGDNVYVGQTLNGIALTTSGMLAGAYLLGADGLNRFIASGGTSQEADGFGTSIGSYIQEFAGFETPDRFETGIAGDNRINGGSANDILRGLSGHDTLNGGAGDDTAVYRGRASEYDVREVSGGALVIEHARGSKKDGTDTLISIEKLEFSDKTIGTDNLEALKEEKKNKNNNKNNNKDKDAGSGDNQDSGNNSDGDSDGDDGSPLPTSTIYTGTSGGIGPGADQVLGTTSYSLWTVGVQSTTPNRYTGTDWTKQTNSGSAGGSNNGGTSDPWNDQFDFGGTSSAPPPSSFGQGSIGVVTSSSMAASVATPGSGTFVSTSPPDSDDSVSVFSTDDGAIA